MVPSSQFNLTIQLSLQASINYDSLVWKARLRKALAALIGQKVHLLDLQEELDKARISSRRYAGIRIVPVDLIRGSENKAQDFDASFKPLNSRNRNRWESVAHAQLNGVSLPPVELIQLGEIYFVRDGHHRVSVAKELGMDFIEAEVVVWKISSALPKDQSPAVFDPRLQMTGQCVHL